MLSNAGQLHGLDSDTDADTRAAADLPLSPIYKRLGLLFPADQSAEQVVVMMTNEVRSCSWELGEVGGPRGNKLQP